MVQSARKSAMLRSQDADEVSACLSDAVLPVKIRPISSHDGLDVALDLVQCNSIKVWQGSCATGMRATPLDCSETVIFHMPIGGQLNFTNKFKQYNASTSIGAVNSPEYLDVFEFSPGYAHYGVAVAALDLEKRISDILESPLRTPLKYNVNFDMHSAPADILISFTQTLIEAHRFDPMSTQCPLTTETLSEAIFTFLIEGFSHSYSSALAEAGARSINDVSPRYVKRAISFMRSEAHRPISIPDIARASNISVRALQYGFRRFAGVSPLYYLQRIRLDRAIEELATEPDTLTIQKIAQKWGFSNPSRFAALCIERLGERPEQLRRDRQLTLQKLKRM